MRLRRSLALLSVLLGFAAGTVATPASAQDAELKVGVTVGPHAQIGEVVREVAARDGLKVKLVEFSDFIQPNAALDAKELDLNIYQHKPFLDAQNKARGYHLVPVATAVVQQMGIYSKRVSKLDDLQPGAKVAIPNDPTNGARALLVLQAARLITLKPGVTVTASLFDIAENPKSLKFIEIEAAQLPHSLKDVDAAAVNSAYAIPAGLSPAKDALALESKDAPFAPVVIAARGTTRAIRASPASSRPTSPTRSRPSSPGSSPAPTPPPGKPFMSSLTIYSEDAPDQGRTLRDAGEIGRELAAIGVRFERWRPARRRRMCWRPIGNRSTGWSPSAATAAWTWSAWTRPIPSARRCAPSSWPSIRMPTTRCVSSSPAAACSCCTPKAACTRRCANRMI